MKKKMTYKEFKEILSETLMPTDYEFILNEFCILLSFQETSQKKMNLMALSEKSKKDRNTIHSALKARGFYDNLK